MMIEIIVIELFQNLSYIHLHAFDKTHKSTHTPTLSLPKTSHSLKGSTFGAFMQLHKVLILLCFCILAQKFTFLRLGPKTLKDKLFCSFNEVFALIKFWVLM